MSNYLPSTSDERNAMLSDLGYQDINDLYVDIPEEILVKDLKLPSGMSELELVSQMNALADKNTIFPSIFRGAGAYHHFIPALVKAVSTKEEFVTTYTPYQAEISQGVLQSIFEYQTMVCELTGLDASNASLYDGATAAAEAVLMCQERKRSKVVISGTLHPQWIEVVTTYCESRDIEVVVIPEKEGVTDAALFAEALDEGTACTLIPQPNYYGILEDVEELIKHTKDCGAKVILAAEPISLGILKSPGELGADICVAEGQPLGLPLSFGGPYLGIITCTQKLLRKLPGRIVGQTVDSRGDRAFVLTLQAREQHIRREKASSNVCSNQALCAHTAAAYLAYMGPSGLAEVAEQSYAKAHYAAEQISSIEGFELAFDKPFFNEFVTLCSWDTAKIEKALAEQGMLAGLPLSLQDVSPSDGSAAQASNTSAATQTSGATDTANALLWCVTEMNSKEQIDSLVKALRAIAEEGR